MADLAGGEDEDGLRIVLTPIQLAAILQQRTLTRWQVAGNRFWGALGVIGGAVDMVASVPLWLAPEPTLGTKVAAGALDYIGADVAWTGLRQVWTGRQQKTFTAEVVDRSLRSLGVEPQIADRLAGGTEVAFNLAAAVAAPIALARAANAARVVAVEEGLIDLEVEERFPGAHTIARHVGRTEEQLAQRFKDMPRLRSASTFPDLKTAERAVTGALRANRVAIEEWAAKAGAGDRGVFHFVASDPVGVTLTKATNTLAKVSGVRVVLVKYVDANRLYYVLTAFPE
jgi:hypothetical protein